MDDRPDVSSGVQCSHPPLGVILRIGAVKNGRASAARDKGVKGSTLRLARVLPAAIETIVCFSVRCCRTSLRTGATNCGLTARKTISAFLITYIPMFVSIQDTSLLGDT